jgi:hypothetical protein
MKKIDSTRKIAPGSTLRLYKKGYGYSRVKTIDVHDLYFGGLSDSEFFSRVSDGDLVEAYLWLENTASYTMTLKVIGRIRVELDDDLHLPILFFSHTDDITASENRRCLEATLSLPVDFFIFSPGADGNKNITTSEIIRNRGTVIRLSDREAVISAAEAPGEQCFMEGCFLKGTLHLPDGEIDVIGTLHHEEPHPDITGALFRVRFNNQPLKERNRLLDYIFSVYRE